MASRGGQTAEQIAAMLTLDPKAVEATLAPPEAMDVDSDGPLPPGLAEAAVTMAERGVAIEQIATMLKVSPAAVRATVAPEGGAAAGGAGGDGAGGAGGGAPYKALGDPMQLRLDALLEEDADACCPVTLVLLVDPVTAKDGFVYERSAVEAMV